MEIVYRNKDGYFLLVKEGGCDIDVVVVLVGIQSFIIKEFNYVINGFSEEYKIGEGVFGEVFKGFLKRIYCVIKKLFLVSIFNDLVINMESCGRYFVIERFFLDSFCNVVDQL